MSVYNFMHSGLHFGKIGEAQAKVYNGVIHLYDIGLPDCVGAVYASDNSVQVQPLAWHDRLVTDALTKSLQNKKRTEQRIPNFRKAPRDESIKMPPRIEKQNGSSDPTPAQLEARANFAERAKRRAQTAAENAVVDIPDGAEAKLKKWIGEVGNCKAVQALVASYPSINRVSVIAVAVKLGIKESTARNEYSIQKRAGRTLETLLAGKKKSLVAKAKPVPKKSHTKPSKVKVMTAAEKKKFEAGVKTKSSKKKFAKVASHVKVGNAKGTPATKRNIKKGKR